MTTLIEAERFYRRPEFTVNDRLSKARRTANVTQDHMAKMLGCSRRTVARYESDGERVPPAVLMAYSVVTETAISWLDEDVAAMCAPRDSNPEPTDSGSAARLAEVIYLDQLGGAA